MFSYPLATSVPSAGLSVCVIGRKKTRTSIWGILTAIPGNRQFIALRVCPKSVLREKPTFLSHCFRRNQSLMPELINANPTVLSASAIPSRVTKSSPDPFQDLLTTHPAPEEWDAT